MTPHRIRIRVQNLIENALNDGLGVTTQIRVRRRRTHPVEKPDEQREFLDDRGTSDVGVGGTNFAMTCLQESFAQETAW